MDNKGNSNLIGLNNYLKRGKTVPRSIAKSVKEMKRIAVASGAIPGVLSFGEFPIEDAELDSDPGYKPNHCDEKENVTMKTKPERKSEKLAILINKIAEKANEISIDKSENTCADKIKELRTIINDALESKDFSNERDWLKEVFKKIHMLLIFEITKVDFCSFLTEIQKILEAELNELREAEAKEDFKQKLLANLDEIYELHKLLS